MQSVELGAHTTPFTAGFDWPANSLLSSILQSQENTEFLKNGGVGFLRITKVAQSSINLECSGQQQNEENLSKNTVWRRGKNLEKKW